MGNDGEKTMDFVEILQGLAPEGETLLVVGFKLLQKIVLKLFLKTLYFL